MQIYQINRKIMPFSSAIQIEENILKVSVKWKSRDDRQIVRSYDLSKIIDLYSEDHGCIALCYTPRMKDELVWHETTRFSYVERISSERSYSSMMQVGLSINDTPQTIGRHNAASPAAILKQRLDATPILYLLTPVRGCSVGDCILVFHGVDSDPSVSDEFRTNHSLSVEEELQSPPMMTSLKMFLEVWLPISLDGPDTMSPDSGAEYFVSNTSGAEIYLEVNSGILNRSRAKSGQSIFLDTRGLSAGEEVVIKAGYKFWPSVSKKKILIT